MSDFAVKVVKIDSVEKHPNADKLDLVHIAGWQCVSTLGQFRAGDLAVYFPIDSVLPIDVEQIIFGVEAKVKLHKSRVRTIKLRGAISQGLIVEPASVGVMNPKVGLDVTEALGVTKYEPPAAPVHMQGQQVSGRKKNPGFHEYTDLSNAKYYPDLFLPGEIVVETEKIHGTNFRAGWVPLYTNTWRKRLAEAVRRLLRMPPAFEFVYGSRRVQLHDSRGKGSGFYEKGSNAENGQSIGNVYQEAVVKYDLRNKIPKGVVVYGEVYGDGIQKGYTYGCGPGERKLVLFDAMISTNGVKHYLDYEDFTNVASGVGVPTAPVVYEGPFDYDLMRLHTKGPSILAPSQKIREGVVVKPLEERHAQLGRVILKAISDDYLLLKDTSDWH